MKKKKGKKMNAADSLNQPECKQSNQKCNQSQSQARISAKIKTTCPLVSACPIAIPS